MTLSTRKATRWSGGLQPRFESPPGPSERHCSPRSQARGLRRSLGYSVLLVLGCSGSISPPYFDEGDVAEIDSSPSPGPALPADELKILSMLAEMEDDVAAESVVASIAHGRYRDGFPWLKVNALPFQSAVAGGTIDVWVSGPGAEAYAAISPDLTLGGREVPPGTMIVREVHDAEGEITTLTLMLKAAPGYNPELGDFWFGVTGPQGMPKMDEESGQLRVGKLDECYGCHLPRVEQGYLFGAPAGNRTAAMIGASPLDTLP